MASHRTLATDLPREQGQPRSSLSPKRPLGQALIAFAVGIGGEFALAIALMPFVQGEDPAPWLLLALWTAGILTKAVVPILMRRDGESWRKYLGSLSLLTWLYAAGGVLALTLGFRLLEVRSFPGILREYRAMMRMADGSLLLGLFMLWMQLLYYAAEGVLMVYIVAKGSEAVAAWRPSWPAWLAGLGGGLLLGLTWGLPHILSQGSIYVGLAGMLQSLVYGLLQGKSRSGVPTWLAWMGFLLL
jgi:hypothetical protein